MNARAIEKTELNKILAAVAGFTTLDNSKARLLKTEPTPLLTEAKTHLKTTEECLALFLSVSSLP